MPTLESIQKDVLAKGWYVPTDARPIGSGGGGAVYVTYQAKEVGELAENLMALGNLKLTIFAQPVAYSLIERLGRFVGANSSVTGALKVPKVEDPRLRREIDAVRRFAHPHLIRLLAADDRSMPRWYVMDLHRGGPIATHAQSFKGKFLEVFRQIRGIADAPRPLHASGFVHRDIKPNNIFLAADGRWVLGDLGIVQIPGSSDLTSGQPPIWSRDWVPDWVIDESSQQRPSLDVYMLCLSAYSMITGGRKPRASHLDEAPFDLRVQFPGDRRAEAAQRFFLDHVVAKERDCKSENAERLLVALDEVIPLLEESTPTLLAQYVSVRSDGDLPASDPDGRLNVEVWVPPAANRIVGRVRTSGRASYLEFTLWPSAVPGDPASHSVLPPDVSHTKIDTVYASSPPGNWSGEVVLPVYAGCRGRWCTLKVQGTDVTAITGYIFHAR